MSRQLALDRIAQHFDSGDFMRDLARRVAIKTESQIPESHPFLRSYLTDEIGPAFEAMGYSIQILDNVTTHRSAHLHPGHGTGQCPGSDAGI